MTTTPANDAATGRRIAHDLAANFIIEAGAGTGKTYALVSRVIALVKAGVPMPNIVAITFTEAAAAELSERIRSRLEQLLTPDHPDNKNDLLAQDLTETHRRRIQTAIAELDQASIQTIHSFAAQILRERPLAAGIPPGWATLDEVEASERFTNQWDQWLEWALGKDTGVDSDLQTALRCLLEVNAGTSKWQDIAQSFAENYCCLDNSNSLPEIDLHVAAATTLRDLHDLSELCTNHTDRLFEQIQDAAATVAAVAEVADCPADAINALNSGATVDYSGTKGSSNRNWSISSVEVRRRFRDEIGKPFQSAVKASPLIPLLHNLRQAFALDYAAQRKDDGVATFDDLLVWARDLLRDNADARAHFRHQYSHILIDEFQDTDPLQAEIAFYLAAAPDAPVGRQDWHTLPLEPGRLFIVGDPKQSIYRFRGADIRVVQQVKDGGQLETLSISENRRSQKPVLDWVNAVFGGTDDAPGLMQPADGMQAEYIPLHSNAGIQQDSLGSVQVFGGPSPDSADSADSVRRRQAVQVANLIAAYASPGPDRLNVYDKNAGAIRPASLRDVCILIRSRTGLNILTRALGDADIPYRLEGAAMFFAAQEVRDLLNSLRAIDDPSDEVSVVAALRSPAFACSDADLLRWRDAGGRWRYSPTPPDTDSPVADGLRTIHDYHEKSRTAGVARLIADFIRERRLDELDLAENRPREIWRRRQFLVEQARSLEHDSSTAPGSDPLTLPKFLRWAQTRADENARITEVPVPEADDDAVRIMTMHAAKGLEFPIVILTGLAGDPRNRSGRDKPALFHASSGPAEVKAGDLQTPGYPDLLASEKAHAAAEAVRLAYVAATRARDHLLVSMHQSTSGNSKQNSGIVAQIARLAATAALPHRAASVDVDRNRILNPPPPNTSSPGRYAPSEWQQSRNAAIDRRSLPQSVTATRIANDGKEHEPGPRQRGRGGRSGTAFGSALHAVLQNILDAMLPELPLPPGQSVDVLLTEWQDRIERQAAAQADSNGIAPHRRGELVRLTRTALRSPDVAAALRAPRLWPEIPVSAPIDTPQGPVVIEGIIDLLYQDDAGQLVILDYKSDDITEADLETRLPHYRQQGAAYAAAVASATGKTVRAVRFLFVRLDTVRSVPNLPDHIARLPAQIAARA